MSMHQAIGALTAQRTRLEQEALQRVASADRHAVDQLKARIAHIDRQLAQSHNPPSLSGIHLLWRGAGVSEVQSIVASRLQHALLEQERTYLQQWLDLRSRGLARTRIQEELETSRRKHQDIFEQLQKNLQQQKTLRQEHPIRALSLGFPEYAQHVRLRQAEKTLREENRKAAERYAAYQQRLAEIPTDETRPSFSLPTQKLDQEMAVLTQAVQERQRHWLDHWITRLDRPLRDVLPVAATIVLLAIVLPLAGRAFRYFVLAPVAARRPPVRILAGPGTVPAASPEPLRTEAGRANEARQISAASLAVDVGPEDDVLCHADSLQSIAVPGEKDTKWLLDWRLPWSSLAAGLVALTRVQPSACGKVVISARQHPLNEVAAIRLPAGAAFVLQPRSVVGIVHPRGRPVRISRHWRLNSFHAWLTLQLRYLVFHGEAILLVQGYRGVRIEHAGRGRMIRQNATIGFSAAAEYKTLRTETFWPYLNGKQLLFNDCFAGDGAWFLYQEAPAVDERNNSSPWRPQGVGDAILRAFGI